MHLEKKWQPFIVGLKGTVKQNENSMLFLERWGIEPHFKLLYYYHNGTISQPDRHINQASHKFHKIFQLYFSGFYL